MSLSEIRGLDGWLDLVNLKWLESGLFYYFNQWVVIYFKLSNEFEILIEVNS